MPKFFSVFFLFFLCSSSFSQILEGSVYSKITQLPLAAATVYLDGTTISTLTDENGYFKLNAKGNSKPDLVISYVGYVTSRINNPFQFKKIKTYIEEDAIGIDEVFIGKGPFTQKEMLKAFKHHFLGSSKAASSCKIENEDDLYFFFDVETNILTASSQNPLKITNDYLGYEINFELIDFEVKYSYRTLNYKAEKGSSFAGTTFFKDIAKSAKVLKRREDAYLGSSTHFINSLANNTLENDRYRIIVDKFQINPAVYFGVTDTLGVKKIKVLKEPMIRVPKPPDHIGSATIVLQKEEFTEVRDFFHIYYADGIQSFANFTSKEYVVDENGNYYPYHGIMFGGYIGNLRAGDMLPTDYKQLKKENP